MSDLIRVLAERLKEAFAAHAALAAEAELARLDAERRAALLRRAAELEADYLDAPALVLRRAAGLEAPVHAPGEVPAANGTAANENAGERALRKKHR